MTPNHQTPIHTFGGNIKDAIKTEENQIAVVDDVCVTVINDKGNVWQSERISWDGIKDLKLQDNLLTGLSYDPMDSFNEWIPFSIDLDTKQITGEVIDAIPLNN